MTKDMTTLNINILHFVWLYPVCQECKDRLLRKAKNKNDLTLDNLDLEDIQVIVFLPFRKRASVATHLYDRPCYFSIDTYIFWFY